MDCVKYIRHSHDTVAMSSNDSPFDPLFLYTELSIEYCTSVFSIDIISVSNSLLLESIKPLEQRYQTVRINSVIPFL